MKKFLTRNLLLQTFLALFLCGSVCANGNPSILFDESPVTSITGTVKGVNGEALRDVSVTVKGTSRGTFTNNDGRFSIEVSGKESVLVFSSVGFKDREVTVGNQTNIDVVLEEEVKSLSDVVVVGYGTQSRKDVSSAIGSLKGADIKAMAVNEN